MKILYYNWVPFLDPLKRGGGVRIYLESLVKQAVAEGHQVTYLSAGLRHNLLRPGLRVRRVAEKLENVREYEVVNSPVLAPSHANFGRTPPDADIQAYVRFLADFIRAEGPFDVIHLQNIEGLPAGLFERGVLFEQGLDLLSPKIFLSLHNYNVLCQQVNLWHNERESCDDYIDGRRCASCVFAAPSREVLLGSTLQELISPLISEGSIWQARAFALASRSRSFLRRAFRLGRLVKAVVTPKARLPGAGYGPRSRVFRDHRSDWLRSVSHMTKLIAVSNRVKQIFVNYGVDENLVVTNYISTAFARNFAPAEFRKTAALNAGRSGLRLAFLGYMREDKGFFFMLDAIEKMPSSVQARLTLKICAPNASGNRSLIERKLARLGDWEVIDGYNHGNLPTLLADVDLGIVPVLWEDNMPQVGYEFVCHGVPVFAADKGGISELVAPPEMTFEAGNSADFGAKLENILCNRAVLASFWDHPAFPIRDWNGHWRELEQLYNA